MRAETLLLAISCQRPIQRIKVTMMLDCPYGQMYEQPVRLRCWIKFSDNAGIVPTTDTRFVGTGPAVSAERHTKKRILWW